MRDAFIKELCEQAKTNQHIHLLTGDLGFSVLEPFAEAYPDQFLNMGIAEKMPVSRLQSAYWHRLHYSKNELRMGN